MLILFTCWNGKISSSSESKNWKISAEKSFEFRWKIGIVWDVVTSLKGSHEDVKTASWNTCHDQRPIFLTSAEWGWPVAFDSLSRFKCVGFRSRLNLATFPECSRKTFARDILLPLFSLVFPLVRESHFIESVARLVRVSSHVVICHWHGRFRKTLL